MLSTLTFSTDNSVKGLKDSSWPEQISLNLKNQRSKSRKQPTAQSCPGMVDALSSEL